MVGQGLLPGRTLSSSDVLSATPLEGGPPRRRPGAGGELRAGRPAVVFQPFFAYARRGSPTRRSGTPTSAPAGPPGRRTVGRLLALQRPVLRAAALEVAGAMAALKLFVAAFGRTCSPARSGCGSAARGGGLVFAFGTFFVVWLAWPLTNVFPLIPWLLLLTSCWSAGPGPPRRASRSWWPSRSSAATPRRRFHVMVATVSSSSSGSVWRPRRERPAARAAAAPGASAPRSSRAPRSPPYAGPRWLELLPTSGDYPRRLASARPFRPRQYLRRVLPVRLLGPADPARHIEPFRSRGLVRGRVTLMLAAAALSCGRRATRIVRGRRRTQRGPRASTRCSRS